MPRLKGVFTKPQLKHIARYLTGLVVCENKTVTGINSSGMEDYELRKLRGVRRHWLMVFLAHDLLQLGFRRGGPIRWMKAGLVTVGSRCRYAVMEVLSSFIELVVNLARKVRTPDEILKLTTSDIKGLKTLYQMEIT